MKGQTNIALFIAIDNYPSGSGWLNIHGSNDYDIVIPFLKKKGYSKKNISALLNENAIKKNIISKLSDLEKVSNKGDNIYIHFSCHGQRMYDNDGDEPDGYDEAVIPYDAEKFYKKGTYEGENHLRDDEINISLRNISYKLGRTGTLMVIFDACHSGTAYRNNDEYIRGTSSIFGTDTAKVLYNHALFEEGDLNRFYSPTIVISACKDDEINYEYRGKSGKYYGILTYALMGIMSRQTAISISTFEELLNKEMKQLFQNKRYKQTPQISYNKLITQVYFGKNGK